MVAGKARTPVKVQNDPPLPLMEVPKNVPLSTKNQSSVNKSLQKSKMRASEYSSRVKRSLIGYFPRVNQVQPQVASDCNSTKYDVNDLEQLLNELQAREAELQRELVDYKVLKERANRVSELEKELDMKNVQAEALIKRINLMESEKNQMYEEIARVSILKGELEAANSKIEDLKRKQHCSRTENEIHELETELMELRQRNSELQQQKSEMSRKLATAESQVVALSSIAESDLVSKAETAVSFLRHTNEDLRHQVEGLQTNRFSDIEELAHLRWINASLRQELNLSKLPCGKRSAEDLNESLSPKSQHIAKQPILECAMPIQGRRWEDYDTEGISSHSSSGSEAGESDSSFFENFPGLLGFSKRSILTGKSRKSKKHREEWSFLQNEDLLDRGIENSHSGNCSPRHSHCCSDSEESWQNVKQQSKTDTVEMAASKLKHMENGNTAKVSVFYSKDPWPSKSHRLEESNKSLCKKVNNTLELSNDMHVSFVPVSKATPRELDGIAKCSSFKDKQNIFLQKEEQTKVERQVTVTKSSEVAKLTPAEVRKRASRIPKPPPKPSSGSAATNRPANGPRSMPPLPPPPPPPPPPNAGIKGAPPAPPAPPPKQLMPGTRVMQRAPEVAELYHSLMKRQGKKDPSGGGPVDAPDAANVRSNMIGEIENRSSHLLAIKTDVETQGDFVRSLIKEVRAAVYINIEDVVAFVKWLDDELSYLVDERAVLKHFDWPERKADALREAACGYCDLKKLETEVSAYEADPNQTCDAAFKRMLALLEKLERRVENFVQMRDMAMARYREFQIPCDWMLDTGIIGKIKFASVKLARIYMKRVAIEVESMGDSEREVTREFLMFQGVRFAFRVHQFAGGFDSESMSVFKHFKNLAETCYRKFDEQ